MKNELPNLPRMLNSVVQHITAAVICDTGSNDGSIEFVQTFFKKHNKPFKVVYAPFIDFSQARNRALMAAKTWHQPFEFILLCDCDMELVVDKPLPVLTAESYTLCQKTGGLSYYNVRLLRKDSPALYHGVTHEYLGANHQEKLDAWYFRDHASGSNRGEKYERDTRLLEGYLANHPNDGRSLFYLAQTQRDSGQHEKALETYTKRIAAGGWDEEIWYSKLQIARTYLSLGNEAEFIRSSLDAYNARPSRAEPIYDLAHYYRTKDDKQQVAWMFADIGSKIPYPGDFLFVEEYVYNVAFLEEKSILGFYNDKTKQIGYEACDKLCIMKEAPHHVREKARDNMAFYLRPLKDFAPGYKDLSVPFTAPEDKWSCTNPSITQTGLGLAAIVRTVNYKIRADGSYDYQGDSAIRTRNHLLYLNDDLTAKYALEVIMPVDWPEPKCKEIMGWEDMRLISAGGELWVNATVLERGGPPQYWREQYHGRINQETGVLENWRFLDTSWRPKAHEKNWMPFADGSLRFMYSPELMLNEAAMPAGGKPTKLDVGSFKVGTQLIRFGGGWLGVIHESRIQPGGTKRFYQHRFCWWDHEHCLQKVSLPFVFHARQIEFAAGMCFNKDGSEVLISFGVDDCEAWIAQVPIHEVRSFLWH